MNDDTYPDLQDPETFGPQGEQLVALIDRARHLTLDEARGLASARDAARDAAWEIAWETPWSAERGDIALDIAWDVAWDVAHEETEREAALDAALDAAWDDSQVDGWTAMQDAALALVVRDLIATDHYDTLTRTWREAIGPIHPDDPELKERRL